MGQSAPASPLDLDELLTDVAANAQPCAVDGEVASYMPSLAEMPGDVFGFAVVEMDGTEHVTGDADEPFPIQSISKVFALVNAMQMIDAAEGESLRKELWQRVDREPSGDPFNSLVQLEHERGVPRNPMMNAGALVVDDLLLSHCEDPRGELRKLVETLVGEPVGIDETVITKEADRGRRNLAMAYLMASFGNLTHDPKTVMEVYDHHCALTMSARQLARSVRFLGNGGVDPASGQRILSPRLARRVAAIMLTCGTYDNAGEFAFSVGFPCKSGIAGGIMGVVTGQLGVCVWSPPLDHTGNSLAGRVALQELSERLGLSLF